MSASAAPKAPVPRLALRPSEAAAAIGVSADHFREHVDHELSWVRRGRSRVVSVVEVERWLATNAESPMVEEVGR